MGNEKRDRVVKMVVEGYALYDTGEDETDPSEKQWDAKRHTRKEAKAHVVMLKGLGIQAWKVRIVPKREAQAAE